MSTRRSPQTAESARALPTKAAAVQAAGRCIAQSLARQAARPAQEAARSALGGSATPEAIAGWIAMYRPETAEARPA